MNAGELMKQAGMTAGQYFLDGVRCIDEKLGEGYAAKHPELVAAFMQTAATDFQTTFWAQEFGRVLNDIADSLHKMQPG